MCTSVVLAKAKTATATPPQSSAKAVNQSYTQAQRAHTQNGRPTLAGLGPHEGNISPVFFLNVILLTIAGAMPRLQHHI
jgi:hypothetical protein